MKTINKIPIFKWFYDQGDTYLSILTNCSDLLKIPQNFYDKKTETFIVGNTPSPNLTYDEKGVTAPMRFGSRIFNCFFPWDCILVMSNSSAVIQFATGNKPQKDPSTVSSDKKKHYPKKKSNTILVRY